MSLTWVTSYCKLPVPLPPHEQESRKSFAWGPGEQPSAPQRPQVENVDTRHKLLHNSITCAKQQCEFFPFQRPRNALGFKFQVVWVSSICAMKWGGSWPFRLNSDAVGAEVLVSCCLLTWTIILRNNMNHPAKSIFYPFCFYSNVFWCWFFEFVFLIFSTV